MHAPTYLDALSDLTTHDVTPEVLTFLRHCIVKFISTLYTLLPNMSKKSAVHQNKVKSAMPIIQTTGNSNGNGDNDSNDDDNKNVGDGGGGGGGGGSSGSLAAMQRRQW
jgi:hypothetical protein